LAQILLAGDYLWLNNSGEMALNSESRLLLSSIRLVPSSVPSQIKETVQREFVQVLDWQSGVVVEVGTTASLGASDSVLLTPSLLHRAWRSLGVHVLLAHLLAVSFFQEVAHALAVQTTIPYALSLSSVTATPTEVIVTLSTSDMARLLLTQLYGLVVSTLQWPICSLSISTSSSTSSDCLRFFVPHEKVASLLWPHVLGVLRALEAVTHRTLLVSAPTSEATFAAVPSGYRLRNVVLLGGTSGSGKSTLAVQLLWGWLRADTQHPPIFITPRTASRTLSRLFLPTTAPPSSSSASLPSMFGFVLPTDYIRDVLRETTNYTKSSSLSPPVKKLNSFDTNVMPLPSELALKTTLRAHAGSTLSQNSALLHCSTYEAYRHLPPPLPTPHEKAVIAGWLMQSSLVCAPLLPTIDYLLSFYTTLIIEGVHLTLETILTLLTHCPHQCIPFLVSVSDPETHRRRFAERTLESVHQSTTNKYLKYFDNIRQIQQHLLDSARLYEIPVIDNINLGVSVEIMQRTILTCVQFQFVGALLSDDSQSISTFFPTSCLHSFLYRTAVKALRSSKLIATEDQSKSIPMSLSSILWHGVNARL
jgi:energy-coupling factor transporter ATP-binding protein EcfA2